jgi:hypothetical protein
MHQLVRILVFADTEIQALDLARRMMQDHLVGRFDPNDEYAPPPYDVCIDFTVQGCGPHLQGEIAITSLLRSKGQEVVCGLGQERWGDIPAVLQVSTTQCPCDDSRGMEEVKKAMKWNLDEFKHYTAKVRELMEQHSDEELFSGAVDDEFQWALQAGAGGDDPFLYLCRDDGYPRRIMFLWALKPIIENTSAKPLWVIPFDVHLN